MTDYSKMSDFEINVAVSLELFDGSSGGDTSRIATWCACKENGEYGLFDPCNNPADAWPIIVEHGISLYHDNGNWQAEMTYDAPVGAFGTDETCSKFVDDKKPLRAAMIVFLMMKDVEKC